MKNNSALFYTCSLIELIGRRQKQKRSVLVRTMGKAAVERIYRYADVFHCEPIEKTADDFITNLNIPEGTFDNVADCRYMVPDYWTIGEVYERLIEDVSGENEEQVIAGQFPIITRIFTISRGIIFMNAIKKAGSLSEMRRGPAALDFPVRQAPF